jgi:parallel beta-helix repeat protein
VIVAGPAYAGQNFPVRDKTTTVRRYVTFKWSLLFAGLLIGVIAGAGAFAVWNPLSATGARTLTVGPAGITAALDQAHSGDTVIIPQGKYRERVELRQGVTLRAEASGNVTLTSPDGGPALVARSVDSGGLEGVWIQGDREAPLSTGIEITDSSPLISNVKVTGATTGIEVRGASSPSIMSSQITNNRGAGILVAAGASPRIQSNLIAANGDGKPGIPRPGVEVMEKAHPVFTDNAIIDNGAEAIWIHTHIYQPAAFEENFFGGVPAKKAIRLIEAPEPGAEK